MRYLACLVVLAILAAPACGGGSDYVQPDLVRVVIQYGVPPNGETGWCELTADGAIITVQHDLTHVPPTLIAHELGHVALLPHGTSPAEIMYVPVNHGLTEPSAAERAAMSAWGETRTMEIVACPQGLATQTARAIDFWNTPTAFKPFNGSMGE